MSFDQSPSPSETLTLNQECGGLNYVSILYILLFVNFWFVCDICGSVVVMCQCMTSWCVMTGSWPLCVGIRSAPLPWEGEEDAGSKM